MTGPSDRTSARQPTAVTAATPIPPRRRASQITAPKHAAFTIDANTGAVYRGPCTQPASPAQAVTSQVLLATLTLSSPCASYAGGAITFGAVSQDSAADADGVATWCRLSDGGGVAVIDLDVSSNAGAGALKLNTTSIITGGPVVVTSLVITLGG